MKWQFHLSILRALIRQQWEYFLIYADFLVNLPVALAENMVLHEFK